VWPAPASILADECSNELGMQNRRIPDDNITASSELGSSHAAAFARLHGLKAWCSKPEDETPYIQILLNEEKIITAIKTQGSYKDLSWARMYEIRYLDKGNWTSYKQVKQHKQECPKVFLGGGCGGGGEGCAKVAVKLL